MKNLIAALFAILLMIGCQPPTTNTTSILLDFDDATKEVSFFSQEEMEVIKNGKIPLKTFVRVAGESVTIALMEMIKSDRENFPRLAKYEIELKVEEASSGDTEFKAFFLKFHGKSKNATTRTVKLSDIVTLANNSNIENVIGYNAHDKVVFDFAGEIYKYAIQAWKGRINKWEYFQSKPDAAKIIYEVNFVLEKTAGGGVEIKFFDIIDNKSGLESKYNTYHRIKVEYYSDPKSTENIDQKRKDTTPPVAAED